MFSSNAQSDESATERDVMDYDVVTVGAGPAVNINAGGQAARRALPSSGVFILKSQYLLPQFDPSLV